MYGKDIHSVHLASGNIVGIRPRRKGAAGCHFRDPRRHRELVVLAQKDKWKLPDSRQIRDFMKGPLVHRALAEEAENDLVSAADRNGECRPARDSETSSDDPICAE